ncbi:MAG: acetyltransferase, family [Pedosphaera sp.]|nr:acetyltransferase, family [Pedosphaera sp.]
MRHSLRAEGFGVRLRPVEMDDAAFILWLRHLNHAKGRVGDSAADITSQQDWLKSYFDREGDFYFIIETLGGISVGTYGLYNAGDGSAESGRWIIRPDVSAAIPSVILAFHIAFTTLRLKEVRVTTVSTNRTVLSLNVKFGFRQTRIEQGAQIIDGEPVDLVHFLLTSQDWAKRCETLVPLARFAETQVKKWAEAQSPTKACGDSEKTVS